MEEPLPEPVPDEVEPSAEPAESSVDEPGGAKRLSKGDAIYSLESPVRCPQCGEVLSELRAVRLLRTEVNFTSMLPRRGRVVVCPYCQTIVPAELTNL
jgi:DNA-directed RNA polymerase subunit RPC12/RpoP